MSERAWSLSAVSVTPKNTASDGIIAANMGLGDRMAARQESRKSAWIALAATLAAGALGASLGTVTVDEQEQDGACPPPKALCGETCVDIGTSRAAGQENQKISFSRRQYLTPRCC
jgi:hypothetical protein